MALALAALITVLFGKHRVLPDTHQDYSGNNVRQVCGILPRRSDVGRDGFCETCLSSMHRRAVKCISLHLWRAKARVRLATHPHAQHTLPAYLPSLRTHESLCTRGKANGIYVGVKSYRRGCLYRTHIAANSASEGTRLAISILHSSLYTLWRHG